MHPLLFHIGPLWIPTYGVMSALALLVALAVIRYYATQEGRDPTQTAEAIFLTIGVGFLGARLLEVAINWDRYVNQPGGLKLLLFSSGVYLGGLASALAFGTYWFHRIKLPYLQGLDLLGPVGAIAEGVGRWGCFFSGCCWGTPTDLPWAVTFPDIARQMHRGLPDVPLHPVQVYLSLNSLAILAVLAWLYRRKRFHGQVITVYVALYCATRFFLETLRGDEERGFVFGGLMSTSQLISLLMVAGAIAGYVYLQRRHRAAGEPDWRAGAGIAAAVPARAKAPARKPAKAGR